MEGNKQDMMDRKLSFLERSFDRLFAAVQQNQLATMLILSIGLNFWQFNINNELNRLRIADITSLNEKVNQAVEKSVSRKLPEQLAPYKDQQDSNTKKLDTSLINLNGTVESVKQYFNKNKRK